MAHHHRARSPPGLEVFDANPAGSGSDDGFDFGDDDDGIVVHIIGSDIREPVTFPADATPYLAELVHTDSATSNREVKHAMLVPREGLLQCRAFIDARRKERNAPPLGGGTTNMSHTPSSAVVKDSMACVKKLMNSARAAHLLRLPDFFERLALEFAAIVRAVNVPYPIRMSEVELYSNKLRAALEMPARSARSLTNEEEAALSLCYGEAFSGDTTQSVAADRRVAHQTMDTKALNLKNSPFVPPSWEDDSTVPKCPDCRREFSTFGLSLKWPVVRSHCRVCGRVKCKDCVKFPADKRYARAYKDTDDPTQLKCCQRCHDESAHESNRQFLHSFIVATGLNIVEVASLQLIDADFVVAAHHVLFDVRQAFVTGDLTPERQRLIMSSRHLGVGHMQWLLAVFRCTNWGELEQAADAFGLLQRTVASFDSHSSSTASGSGLAASSSTTRRQPSGGAPRLATAEELFADDDVAAAGEVPSSSSNRAANQPAPPRASSAAAGAGAAPRYSPKHQRATAFPHWILMCSRACTEPMLDYYAVEFLRVLNSVPSNFGGGYVDSCRTVAAELFLNSITSRAMKNAWVPVILDLFNQEPTPAAVDVAKSVLLRMCEGDRSTTMMVRMEATARQKHCDTAVRRDLASVTNDIMRNGMFTADELANATAFIEALEDATNNCRGGTESDARLALYRELVKARLVLDEDAAATRQLNLNASFGSMSVGSVPRPSSIGSAAGGGVGGGAAVPDRVRIRPIPYLFDPEITIVAVDFRRLAIMASKVRPWVVALVSEDGGGGASAGSSPTTTTPGPGASAKEKVQQALDADNVHLILYKREDVRQDYVVCNTFAAFNEFFVQRGLMRRPVTTYRVLPTGSDRGIIQMVKKSRSVSVFTERSNTPMSSWLEDHIRGLGTGVVMSADPAERERRQRVFKETFLDSARFYTLGTFLLGVGDRHRGNVLLCEESGSICHIDFGFVLGATTTTEAMTQKFVRYDEDLRYAVERHYGHKARDGVSGRRQSFHDDTADMLLALRPHAGFVKLLLNHWAQNGMVSAVVIDRFLASRFFLSSNDTDARSEFVRRIEGSFGKNWIQDAAHDVGQYARRGGEGLAGTVASLAGASSWLWGRK